jgi:GDP-L-fucose synthase
MKKYSVLILGSNGLVGSSLVRTLENSSKVSYIYKPSRKELDLFSLDQTKKFISSNKPEIIINAAAKVGGILANNTNRSSFIIDNLKINLNVYESCINFPEIKIINLGSSCIYPLNAENPIKEDSIMTGKLEETNSPYAVAKLAAIEIADSLKKEFGHEVINLMPTNLYGPRDNFSENDSHVIPGLIYRMHKAKLNNEMEFKIWGTGKPLREFLYVDDLSDAIEFLLDKKLNRNLYNIGSGIEISILDLANTIKEVTDYKGSLIFDESKPDGNPRKLVDSSLINEIGWSAKTSLTQGIKKTYTWFTENI